MANIPAEEPMLAKESKERVNKYRFGAEAGEVRTRLLDTRAFLVGRAKRVDLRGVVAARAAVRRLR
ncbi:hypothetical protein [Shewanella sp.]|uniref:hypothetical protein n=1 Tax=Shewanella sp. TaxID=50422 RepID=UPI00404805B2